MFGSDSKRKTRYRDLKRECADQREQQGLIEDTDEFEDMEEGAETETVDAEVELDEVDMVAETEETESEVESKDEEESLAAEGAEEEPVEEGDAVEESEDKPEESEDDQDDSEEGLEDFEDDQIYDVHNDEEDEPRRRKRKGKGILIALGLIAALILAVYLAGVAVFSQFFFYGTAIDGQDYFLKKVEDVETYQMNVVEEYKLTLTMIDGSQEALRSDDIGLTYVKKTEISTILEEQNPLEWPLMFFEIYEYTTTITVEYDEEMLSAAVANLMCMDEANMVPSTDAYVEFQGDAYVIVPYELGTEIDGTILESAVIESVLARETELNLEEIECYVLPEVTEDSQDLIDLAATLNSYLHGTIAYSEGEVIDEAVLSSWIIIGEDNTVTFDEELITEFVSALAEKYNTVGTTRTFTAADGATAEVSGGSFGWTVDEEAEIAQIIADIEAGEAVEREISYSKRGVSHGDVDWGDTYTEIDLTDQKVYYILDGEVVVSGDIVTGDVDGGNATPQGVYSLSYKTTNAVLRGTKYADGTYEYESPVSFWMPFNGGIGMHDASWRSTFGGSIYQTSGSHGCINMAYATAQAIYNYISAGEPVICHY